jgi:hypothetical protein
VKVEPKACDQAIYKSSFTREDSTLEEGNDERGTMNDEVKATAFQFIVHRSSFACLVDR